MTVAATRGAGPSGQGYAGCTSVQAGHSFTLHLALSDEWPGRGGTDEDGADCWLELRRVGGDPDPVPLHAWRQRLLPAPPAGPRAWEGLAWPVSREITTETHWASGLYGVNPAGGSDWCCVVVRAPSARQRLLVAVDFVTPQAYCNAGGKSLYAYNSDGEAATCVGFDRPGALPYPEYRLARWLDRQGIAADWCCTLDLAAEPDLLASHDCLVVGGHFEYWTGTLRERLDHFVRRGGRLIVLSGNTGYRQVRWNAVRRQVHYWHRPDRDPCTRDDQLAVAFSEPPLSRPVNRLLGGGWWCGAYAGEPSSVYRSAYTCLLPGHWVFDGVWPPSHQGPLQTAAFMHYETDAVDASVRPQGHALATGRDGAPLHTVVLARADLRHWSRPGWATMSLVGIGLGRVFHAGTTEWLDALDGGDAQLSRVTLNVLRRFLSEPVGIAPGLPGHAEAMGRLPGPGCLLPGPRGLYCCEVDGRLWRRDAVPAALPWQDAGRLPVQGGLLCHDGHAWWLLSPEGVLWGSSHEDPGWHAAWRPVAEGGPQSAALCALPQCLYAATTDGRLWRRPTRLDRSVSWQPMRLTGITGPVGAMAVRDHHLLLCADRGAGCAGLWRTDGGFIEDSTRWVPLHTWTGAVWSGLAPLDELLYIADATGNLYGVSGEAWTGRGQGAA